MGGIAHHPLQSVMVDGGSPRSLVTGVGLGLVGMVTKPLSGAAELVALTGQGKNTVENINVRSPEIKAPVKFRTINLPLEMA